MPRWITIGWWRRLFRDGAARESLGFRGETAAADYLRGQGFRIVTRNRRHGKGEIDLIAVEKEFLVFVEVRTRENESFMSPEASIRREKQRTMLRTVRRLLRRHRTAGLTPRIDVVAVIWPEGAERPAVIRHHRGVLPLDRW